MQTIFLTTKSTSHSNLNCKLSKALVDAATAELVLFTLRQMALSLQHTVALVCAPRFQLKAFVALLASAI